MKRKTLFGIIGILLLLAVTLFCAIGSSWFTNSDIKTWFNNWWQSKQQIEEPNISDDNTPSEVSGGGLLISDGEDNFVKLTRARIALENYADYGIDTQAESAYTITAYIYPSAADDKRVEWTVAPKSGNVNASDYITLTANGLTATVACKQAFDVQFIVTCKSLENPEAKATCTLDYVERVTGVTVNMPKLTSTTAEVTYTTTTSKYTIKSDINVTFSNFVFNDGFSGYFVDANGFAEDDYLCFHPTYTNQLVQYTSTGLKFVHGGSIAESRGYDVCPDGLVGCIFAMSGQAFGDPVITESCLIAAFVETSEEVCLGTVDVTVSATYGGNTYSSVSKSVEIWVEGSAFHIPVTSLTLNNSSILF